jgi:hypothetical protein
MVELPHGIRPDAARELITTPSLASNPPSILARPTHRPRAAKSLAPNTFRGHQTPCTLTECDDGGWGCRRRYAPQGTAPRVRVFACSILTYPLCEAAGLQVLQRTSARSVLVPVPGQPLDLLISQTYAELFVVEGCILRVGHQIVRDVHPEPIGAYREQSVVEEPVDVST